MDQFEKAGYGTETIGFGEKAAVLVVDFQKGFTDPASAEFFCNVCKTSDQNFGSEAGWNKFKYCSRTGPQ